MASLRSGDRLVERVDDWYPPLAPLLKDMSVQAQAQSSLRQERSSHRWAKKEVD
jgi:hypothetical protein